METLIKGQRQKALADETKRRVFQIPCEMQRGLDLLPPNYKREKQARTRP